MIAKKNKKVNLERKRFAFFQIGLLISGSLCLAAFEYTTVKPDEQVHVFDEGTLYIPVDEPADEDKFKFVEDQPKRTVTVISDLEKVKIVDVFEKKGDPIITSDPNVINMSGDGDPDLGYIDMGLEEEEDLKDYEVVDVMPKFPGGEEAMFAFVKKHVQYPELPKEMGIQGIVYVHFVVSKTGSIEKVTSSHAPHHDLATEAMRVVNVMPRWVPGEQAGKRVNVKYTLPIHFKMH